MKVKTPDNFCVMCGTVIPEGRQACPHCEAAVSETTDKIMTKVNEGMKHACEVRQDNERLKRENAFLRGQLEARARIDDIDGCYD